MTDQPRHLHLNAFLMAGGHHEAAWRLPEADPDADVDIEHWKHLARIAEAARFDSLFLADSPALWQSAAHRPSGALEPLTVLTALAGVTERIGLIATASSTYNSPYNLARRFASLDHVSGGRAGWNLVTTAGPNAARNFGLTDQPGHTERYERAQEFLDVVRALWDSWGDDATIADKTTGRYADPNRIRPIDHSGRFYRVAGPLNVRRPPQGHPLLVQAGSSTDGRAFAARNADAIFTAHQTLDDAVTFSADVKAQAAAAGRDPDTVKILPGIVPVLGATEQQARDLDQQLRDLQVPEYGLEQLAGVLEVPASTLTLDAGLPAQVLARPLLQGAQSRSDLIIDLALRENLTVRQILHRLGGGRGHFTVVGTPDQVAQVIRDWFTAGAADGFNVMAPVLPSGLETFIDGVLPILRDWDLFPHEYTGHTLRDHYGLPRPAARPHPAYSG
ncbi:MAG TPA: LLM class flavin-dependent oxidoreductase [Kineosporiaceae bacterium]